MRLLFTILLVTTVSAVFGQTDFNSVLKNVQTLNLPYTTEQGNNIVREKKKILNTSDSVFIVTRLNSKLPKTINPFGVSPFGQIDCEDTSDCLKIKDVKEIAILSFIKVSDDSYLLHLEFTETGQFGMLFGILVSMNKNGDIIDWFFSDGSVNAGNPHGNVSRDFTIQKDMSILIDEASWGDNTITYGFKATYKVASKVDENNGEFELKSLCIDY